MVSFDVDKFKEDTTKRRMLRDIYPDVPLIQIVKLSNSMSLDEVTALYEEKVNGNSYAYATAVNQDSTDTTDSNKITDTTPVSETNDNSETSTNTSTKNKTFLYVGLAAALALLYFTLKK